MPSKKKLGTSTRMPSVSLTLGCYVVVRPRKDGTNRVLFELPARLRPSGWPATIPLPRSGPRTGDLSNAEEVARIKEDARKLYEALEAGRDKEPAVEGAEKRHGTIPWLIVKWGGERALKAVVLDLRTEDVALRPGDDGREEWIEAEPRTRRFYIQCLRPVFLWSETQRHPHARAMLPGQIRSFFDLYKKKPGQRKNVRAMLNQLLGIALEEGEITINPLASVKRKQTKRRKIGSAKRKVVPWTREDVRLYQRVAGAPDTQGGMGWRGGADMIALMWETAADSTDVTVWKKGEGGQFRDDAELPGIDFDRGKTGEPTFVPISTGLAERLRKNGSIYLVTDPHGLPFRPVIDDNRIAKLLAKLRRLAVKAGGRDLLPDHLRHSAATDAVANGIEESKVRHLTAHKNDQMNRRVYVQRVEAITSEIQKARGIID